MRSRVWRRRPRPRSFPDGCCRRCTDARLSKWDEARPAASYRPRSKRLPSKREKTLWRMGLDWGILRPSSAKYYDTRLETLVLFHEARGRFRLACWILLDTAPQRDQPYCGVGLPPAPGFPPGATKSTRPSAQTPAPEPRSSRSPANQAFRGGHFIRSNQLTA